MQHTLVPPHDRKLLRREYHVRAWIIALFAISTAGVIGVAALFPAFMKGTLEERLQLQTIASLEKNKDERGITSKEQELAADKLLLAALTEGSNNRLLSVEMEDVLKERGTVTLTAFSISRVDDGSMRIVLQGIAPTREALLGFKSRLETGVPGTTVILPISQLTRSTRIQFSMEVIRPKP